MTATNVSSGHPADGKVLRFRIGPREEVAVPVELSMPEPLKDNYIKPLRRKLPGILN